MGKGDKRPVASLSYNIFANEEKQSHFVKYRRVIRLLHFVRKDGAHNSHYRTDSALGGSPTQAAVEPFGRGGIG